MVALYGLRLLSVVGPNLFGELAVSFAVILYKA